MTQQEERYLITTVRSLKRELSDIKGILNPSPNCDLLNTKQAMVKLGIGKTKIKEMLANGELPFATKVGNRWRFSEKAIANYLNRN
ncbi:MAG: helix-turn-helix domain-containing protein [Bacteroides sp.]